MDHCQPARNPIQSRADPRSIFASRPQVDFSLSLLVDLRSFFKQFFSCVALRSTEVSCPADTPRPTDEKASASAGAEERQSPALVLI